MKPFIFSLFLALCCTAAISQEQQHPQLLYSLDGTFRLEGATFGSGTNEKKEQLPKLCATNFWFSYLPLSYKYLQLGFTTGFERIKTQSLVSSPFDADSSLVIREKRIPLLATFQFHIVPRIFIRSHIGTSFTMNSSYKLNSGDYVSLPKDIRKMPLNFNLQFAVTAIKKEKIEISLTAGYAYTQLASTIDYAYSPNYGSFGIVVATP